MMLGAAVLPLVVAVAGALLYALASNPKLARMGEILFFCGAFWLVYLLGGKAVRF
ncbi:MAG TPA: hypothetical protein VE987_12965 [Polyangiaceae bacterium]|nr:hypothetical protein [Polyangiaceae bacterium]